MIRIFLMFFKDIHYWWQSSHSQIGHHCLLDVLSTKNLRRSFLHNSLYGYHPGGRPQVHNDNEDDNDGDDCDLTPMMINHTSYLSRTPRIFSCKFFLAGVIFYKFNAKNWQFTVYFAVITQKIGNFLCILS